MTTFNFYQTLTIAMLNFGVGFGFGYMTYYVMGRSEQLTKEINKFKDIK